MSSELVRKAQWRPGHRRPRASTLLDLGTISSGSFSGIGQENSHQHADQQILLPNGHTGKFAFWSVIGAQNTIPLGSLEAHYQIEADTDADTDVVATAIYIEEVIGIGLGYRVDAFDLAMGNFFDDDFVIVGPDRTGNITRVANEDGFVPTTVDEDIQALPCEPRQFYGWLIVGGELEEGQRDLHAMKDSSAVAIAFYKSPDPILSYDEYLFKMPLFIPRGCFRQLSAAFELTNAAINAHPDLRTSIFDLASKQVSLASELMISSMKSAIVQEGKISQKGQSDVHEQVLKEEPLLDKTITAKKK
jgi:hypothetical protein